MEKRIIIGLGTGRCGTTSLARLLGSVPNCVATHEMDQIRANLEWKFNMNRIEKALKILKSAPENIVCDVAFYYLPYVKIISEMEPTATFVCLKRNREETVKSYMYKTEGRDHWRVTRSKPNQWDKMYPKFEAQSKEEAIGMYWDMYYRTTSEMEKEGIRIRTFDTVSLNDSNGTSQIMKFCGLEADGNLTGIHENKSKKKGKTRR